MSRDSHLQIALVDQCFKAVLDGVVVANNPAEGLQWDVPMDQCFRLITRLLTGVSVFRLEVAPLQQIPINPPPKSPVPS